MLARDQYKISHNLFQLEHYVDSSNEMLSLIMNQVKQAMARETKVVTHVVTDADTLRSIAKKYYGDINLWRKLAKYNNAPVDIETGSTIIVPDKEVLNGI